MLFPLPRSIPVYLHVLATSAHISPSVLVLSVAIIKYLRLGVYKEDIYLSRGLGCQKSKTRKLIYSASSEGLQQME